MSSNHDDYHEDDSEPVIEYDNRCEICGRVMIDDIEIGLGQHLECGSQLIEQTQTIEVTDQDVNDAWDVWRNHPGDFVSAMRATLEWFVERKMQ
jgi:hypothetical protein